MNEMFVIAKDPSSIRFDLKEGQEAIILSDFKRIGFMRVGFKTKDEAQAQIEEWVKYLGEDLENEKEALVNLHQEKKSLDKLLDNDEDGLIKRCEVAIKRYEKKLSFLGTCKIFKVNISFSEST